jgi:GH24 family phage-related lysozyme (muramidase)
MADQDVIDGLMHVLPGFEGEVQYMYLDGVGKVTVGIGHMIPDVASAQSIPFVSRASGAAASAEEIETDFEAVAAAIKGQLPPAYQGVTSLSLPEGWANQDASQRLLNEFLPPLKTQYPDYDGYPQPAQEALLDMIYNLGAGGLAKYKQLKAAVVAGNWQEASAQSHRNGIQQSRNDWTAQQFLAAAG